MDNKKHNASLIILLVVFIFISLALGSFVFYDKVLKNYINSPIQNNDYDSYNYILQCSIQIKSPNIIIL